MGVVRAKAAVSASGSRVATSATAPFLRCETLNQPVRLCGELIRSVGERASR